MADVFHGHPIRLIPWVFSLLRDIYRFYWSSSEGECLLGTTDLAVSWALEKEYEQQIRAELRDPEWPNRYWAEQEADMYEFADWEA